MQTTEYRDPRTDTELRTALCDWLNANGIDPALVPGDEKPDCSYRGTPGVDQTYVIGGHTITTRIRIRIAKPGTHTPGSHDGRLLRFGANRLEETTVTVKMVVEPPLIVQQWLDSRCPTCQA